MKTIDTTSMSNYITGTPNSITGTKTNDLVYYDTTSIPYEWITDLQNTSATVTISSDSDVYVEYAGYYNGSKSSKKDTKKKKKTSKKINDFKELDIEKIEANSKKDSVTVFWKNNNFRAGSKYGTRGYTTTVHRMDGDADNLLNAVAAAFCINKYRSNAQFKKVMKDKYGTDDMYEIVAIFELVEHFGSIKKVVEILSERTNWLYPEYHIDRPIDLDILTKAIKKGIWSVDEFKRTVKGK